MRGIAVRAGSQWRTARRRLIRIPERALRPAELSERSGVSTATIKYCLREGLLQPGRRISATRAEYGEDHPRRLRLVRALIRIGGVPVAAAREVIPAMEDESLDHHPRLGAATRAPPCVEGPAGDDPAVVDRPPLGGGAAGAAGPVMRPRWACSTPPTGDPSTRSPSWSGSVGPTTPSTRCRTGCWPRDSRSPIWT
ncbi:MerR family transcriptional regulator [Streptomyces sp. NPDC006184]|uniref:MerR family transcriptional regulator n=1 Tax=Streptomyces sp. NPDC006184 TaxID=3155455 RepID=UPI0033B96A72